MRLRSALAVLVVLPLLGVAACPGLSGNAPVPCALVGRLTGELVVDLSYGVAEGCGPLRADGGTAGGDAAPEDGGDAAGDAGDGSSADANDASDGSSADAGDGSSADAADGSSADGGDGGAGEADAGEAGAGEGGLGPLVTFQWGSAFTQSTAVAVEMPLPTKDAWSHGLPATVRIVDGERVWQTAPMGCQVEIAKSTVSARRVPNDGGPFLREHDLEGKGTCFSGDAGGIQALPIDGGAKSTVTVGDFTFRVWYLYP